MMSEAAQTQRGSIGLLLARAGLLLWLAAIVFLLLMLYLRGEDEMLSAVETGRYLEINVETSEITGNMLTTNAGGSLSDAEYKKRRIEEMTGKAVDTLPLPTESPQPDTATQSDAQPSSEDASAAITQTKPSPLPVSSPPPVTVVERPLNFPLTLEADPRLQEAQANGSVLPRRGEGGALIPWRYYGKPFESASTPPHMLVLVISGLGLNRQLTQQALSLDESVTLAFSPYAQALSGQIAVARASGFESWVMLPMQPEGYPINDEGALSLRVDDTPQDNIGRLQRILASAQSIPGMMTSKQERFTRLSPQAGSVYDELARRGLLLATHNAGLTASQQQDTPLLRINAHYDAADMSSDVATLLKRIQSDALESPYYVVSIEALPSLIEALPEWLQALPAHGVTLVPFTALAHPRTSSDAGAE